MTQLTDARELAMTRLVDTELAWSLAFEAGIYTDPLIAPGTGERVATRIPEAAVTDLAFGRPPKVKSVHGLGPVVVTDRRVVLATIDGSAIAWQCQWSSHIQGVAADADGCGVLVFPDDDVVRRGGGVWGVVPAALLAPSPPDRDRLLLGFLMWRRVVAAWSLATGHIDEWRATTAAYGKAGV